MYSILIPVNRIQLFQLRLSQAKRKIRMGVIIKNTQTEQNLVSRDT